MWWRWSDNCDWVRNSRATYEIMKWMQNKRWRAIMVNVHKKQQPEMQRNRRKILLKNNACVNTTKDSSFFDCGNCLNIIVKNDRQETTELMISGDSLDWMSSSPHSVRSLTHFVVSWFFTSIAVLLVWQLFSNIRTAVAPIVRGGGKSWLCLIVMMCAVKKDGERATGQKANQASRAAIERTLKTVSYFCCSYCCLPFLEQKWQFFT